MESLGVVKYGLLNDCTKPTMLHCLITGRDTLAMDLWLGFLWYSTLPSLWMMQLTKPIMRNPSQVSILRALFFFHLMKYSLRLNKIFTIFGDIFLIWVGLSPNSPGLFDILKLMVLQRTWKKCHRYRKFDMPNRQPSAEQVKCISGDSYPFLWTAGELLCSYPRVINKKVATRLSHYIGCPLHRSHRRLCTAWKKLSLLGMPSATGLEELARITFVIIHIPQKCLRHVLSHLKKCRQKDGYDHKWGV